MVSCGQKEAHHLFINPPEGLQTIPCGQAESILWVRCYYKKAPKGRPTKLLGQVGMWAGELQFPCRSGVVCMQVCLPVDAPGPPLSGPPKLAVGLTGFERGFLGTPVSNCANLCLVRGEKT